MKIHHLMFGAVLLSGCSGSIDVGPGGSASAGSPAVAVGSGMSTAGGSSAGAPATSSLPGAPACTLTTPLPAWPSAADCVADDSLAISGTWHGYVELAQSPWDDLTLTIQGKDQAGNPCGTLTMGEGSVPAPATDPDAGYLADTSNSSLAIPAIIRSAPPGDPLDILNVTFDGTRLTFSASYQEPYRSWCQLQTSYQYAENSPDSCGCLPGWSGGGSDAGCYLIDPTTNASESVSCPKMGLCGASVCSCNATGCDASPNNGPMFDLRLTSANALEGANSESTTSARTFFTRMP